ncbi:MAG: TonB-dependent receptor [Tahibacter sp.]
MVKSRLWVALWAAGAFGAATLINPASLAQAAEADAAQDTSAIGAPETTELEAVSVVGSRRYGRSSETETAVPVDIVPMDKPAEQGAQFDLAQTLQYIAPSFNSTRQTGADNADLIDSAALRGLGSDQTLVLENGKRRHSVALVNLFGARNRGNTGTDLNAIPLLAIDHVEILRDGAAAQYGSDAIAGVMNIVLKKNKGCEAVAGYGEYSRGDGENTLGSAYCGFEVGNDGVIAMTAEWLKRGRSDRSGDDNPRTIGDTKVDNRTFYINGEVPLGDAAHFYFTGGLQKRDASSAAFARGGIGSDDIPSRNSAAMYPDGFVPFINGEIEDRYAIVGIWGMLGSWRADLSQTYGYNDLRNDISNTLNASIANLDLSNGGSGISANKFDAGGFSFRQLTTNVDISRFREDVFHGLNLAFGAERRSEDYQIFAGEPGSYIDADGAGGGNAGSQGFPGFQPGDETNKSRTSWAVYADIEADLTDRLTTGVAARHEHYSDFGSTTIGKLSSAFRVTDNFLLRGSVSTGFRAPSLQQRYFSSTFTDFVSGQPVDVLLAPNGGELAQAAGIPALKEEKSTGYTLGFTWKPTDAISVTLDGYRINIKDRIVLTGRFESDDPDIGDILTARGVGEAQFFINSVDTKTQGIDLTFSHTTELGGGEFVTYLAFNHGITDVTKIHTPANFVGREDTLLSERERLFIEEGAPSTKATLAFDYTNGPWNGNVKFIHFGSQTLGTFSGPPEPNAHYSPKTSADVSTTYAFTENTKLTLGVANLFDQFPSRQNPDETDNGFKYDSVQFGLNGRAYFARLWMKF